MELIRLTGMLLVAAPLLAQTPPGTLVDVGGYRVHVYCTGSGTPTVIFIGGFSFDWALVQPEVATVTRACAYDASGNAWSEPDPGHPEPTCLSRVDEIHHLLANAKVPGPYVLAGFSTGALLARLYAKSYPKDIAAMVLIDHAYLPEPVAPPPVSTGPDSPPALISAPPIEIDVEDEPGFDKLPVNVRGLHRWALLHDAPRNRARDARIAEACISELGNATLGALPLVVVGTANDSPGYAKLQTNLLALSPNSSQLIASESFHSVEISQPEVVIRAIRRALLESRQ
jgi:pimeloyl-ACP methyl ester carboxylesterase